MTQLEAAVKNKITPEMKSVAESENVSEDYILKGIQAGEIIIPKNINHKIKKVCGIGRGLRTKVNVNLGTSPVHMNIKEEISMSLMRPSNYLL